jgi:L-lactate utilization protein LutB
MNEAKMKIEEQLSKTIEQLKRNSFDVILAENARDATDKIIEIIPPNATVGVANSVTVRQIGILDALKKRGNQLIDQISMG